MRHVSSMSTRRRLIAILAVVGVLAVGGAAFAYFTAGGAGTGSASTGTMSPTVLQAVAGTPSTPLYPGSTGGDVVLTVENPNSYPVTLVSVTSNGTITHDSGHPNCTTSGVTFTNWTGSTAITAVSGGTQTIHLANSASMSSSSSNGCQGATFSIPVTITVEK